MVRFDADARGIIRIVKIRRIGILLIKDPYKMYLESVT